MHGIDENEQPLGHLDKQPDKVNADKARVQSKKQVPVLESRGENNPSKREALLERIRMHREHMKQEAEELVDTLNLPHDAVYDFLAVSYGQDHTASGEKPQIILLETKNPPKETQQRRLDLRDIKYQSCPIDDEDGTLVVDFEAESMPEMDEDGNYLYCCASGYCWFTVDEEEGDYQPGKARRTTPR